MSVLSCNRNCCENIMCDTYINGIGYICNECQNEFKQSFLPKKGIVPMTEPEILIELTEFMKTEKGGIFSDREISVDEFFKENTRE